MHMHLFKMGYITIPLIGKNPAPGVRDWGIWAVDGIPESEVERFERDYPLDKFGIGVVAGPASNNIVIVDCDSVGDDIKSLVPRSPLSRVGLRGFGRFFVNKLDIPNCEFMRKNRSLATDPSGKPEEGIEVRARGLYMAIPPTVHPDTGKPYYWEGENTIDTFNPDYIPALLETDVETFQTLEDAGGQGDISLSGIFVHHDHKRCPNGSHNRLKKLASGLIAGLTPVDRAIDELLKYDEHHHRPVGYFADRSRSECRSDRYSNAAKFYTNILASHNRERQRKGVTPQVPSATPTVSITELSEKKQPAAGRAFPELPGLLGIFKDGILHKSRRDQEALAIGGALALGSTLCAHRFSIDRQLVHTKLYILNIGKTGVGKDAPFKYIKAVLSHPEMRSDNLLGFENYSSKAAILETLTRQKVRLDLRDEFKDTFIAIASNAGATGNEISSFLNQHYTDSGWYGGHYTKTDKWVGACFDPSISLLAGIQPQELINNATASNFSDGFIGRFLAFVADTRAAHVGRQHNALVDVVDYAAREIRRVLPALRYDTKNLVGQEVEQSQWMPVTEPLAYAPAYARHRDDMDRYLADQEDKLDEAGREHERSILTRQNMFIERITLIIAACSGDRTVTVKHSELAEKLVSVSQARSLDVMGVSGMSKLEIDAERVLNKIKQNGFMKRGDISKLTKRNKKEMSELIDTMIERDLITESKSDSPAKNGVFPLVYHVNAQH
jgi:hypothetical protein